MAARDGRNGLPESDRSTPEGASTSLPIHRHNGIHEGKFKTRTPLMIPVAHLARGPKANLSWQPQ